MLNYGVILIFVAVFLPKAENFLINLKIHVTTDDKHASKGHVRNTTVVVEPVVDDKVEKQIEEPELVDDACLHSICGENCFERPHCHEFNETVEHHGPFLLTKLHWHDADMPTLPFDDPKREGAFLSCACDYGCSTRTVQKYLKKFAVDCNYDKELNCDDHKLIHEKGPEHCLPKTIVRSNFLDTR